MEIAGLFFKHNSNIASEGILDTFIHFRKKSRTKYSNMGPMKIAKRKKSLLFLLLPIQFQIVPVLHGIPMTNGDYL